MQILNTRMTTGQKSKFCEFKMVDGRHIANGFIAISQLRIIRCRWNWCPDAKSKLSKFKMVDVRHIENHLLAIGQRFIVQLTRNLLREAEWRWDKGYTWPNNEFRKFKMAEGRYFENDPRVIRFWWNLLCTCMFRFREWSPDEKSKFCIFKMADGRHLEYCNLATCPRIIVRLAPNLVWRSSITHIYRSCDQNSKFRKFKMTDACHFENVYVIWHISGNKTAKINVKKL